MEKEQSSNSLPWISNSSIRLWLFALVTLAIAPFGIVVGVGNLGFSFQTEIYPAMYVILSLGACATLFGAAVLLSVLGHKLWSLAVFLSLLTLGVWMLIAASLPAITTSL